MAGAFITASASPTLLSSWPSSSSSAFVCRGGWRDSAAAGSTAVHRRDVRGYRRELALGPRVTARLGTSSAFALSASAQPSANALATPTRVRVPRIARAAPTATRELQQQQQREEEKEEEEEEVHLSSTPPSPPSSQLFKQLPGSAAVRGGAALAAGAALLLASASAAAGGARKHHWLSELLAWPWPNWRQQQQRQQQQGNDRAAHAAVDILPLLDKLLAGDELTMGEAASATDALLERGGAVDAHQVAAFVSLLRRNGESAAVLAGMAAAMLERAVPLALDYPALDIVGTGGDGANTVNISTAAGIVAAACGARVAKHGNRSSSSMCGSADVLEALGVRINLSPRGARSCLDDAGIAFLMAPAFHPALKNVAAVRRGLRFRTVFNMLGPLVNPARAERQVLGVAAPELMHTMADAVAALGTTACTWVVHCCGLDEIAPIGATQVIEVTGDGAKRSFTIVPEELGMPRCALEELIGGDAAANAEAIRRSLGGEPGAVSNAIVLNAGAGLVVYGLADDLADGCAMAAQALISGNALDTLDRWVEVSTGLR